MRKSGPEPRRPAIAVDAKAQPRPGLGRFALAPVSLVVCAALFYALRWPMAGVVAVALCALLVSIWIGPLLDRSRRLLDRDLVTLLSAGNAAALLPRVRGATLLRWLGARGEYAEREGRALRAARDRAGALRAYREALAGYDGGRAPLSLVAGLGHAAYEAGETELAKDALSAALASSPGLPEVAARVAHLSVLSGEPFELAEADGSETARLVRALAALRAGDPAPARAALREIEADEAASWARARADVAAEVAARLSKPPKKKKARAGEARGEISERR